MKSKMVKGSVTLLVWLEELERIVREDDPDAACWMSFDEEVWDYDYMAGHTPEEALDEYKECWA